MYAKKAEGAAADVRDASSWVRSDGPRRLAPAGFYIAIRISFIFPVLEQNADLLRAELPGVEVIEPEVLDPITF